METVPVDPIQKSTRGWFHIAQAIAFAAVLDPTVREAVSDYPRVAGGLAFAASAINWYLLFKSKQGVVSKNVEIK